MKVESQHHADGGDIDGGMTQFSAALQPEAASAAQSISVWLLTSGGMR
jgi:hypothetical protein